MSDFRVDDESGDRKYFTIVPNYILNHSSAIDQALYLQMKRFAGERGSCFASGKTLRKQLGIGKPAYRRAVKYLLEHEWIYYKGKQMVETTGGAQMVPVYGIKDLWKRNNEHYDKGGYKKTHLGKGGTKSAKGGLKEPQGGHQQSPKKNHEEDLEEKVFVKQERPDILKRMS